MNYCYVRRAQYLSAVVLVAAIVAILGMRASQAQAPVRSAGPSSPESKSPAASLSAKSSAQASRAIAPDPHVQRSAAKPELGGPLFIPAVNYGAGLEHTTSVAIADLNGDGKLDLAVAGNDNNGNGMVSIFPGNGDGTFQPQVSYGSGGTVPESVAIADLNGDGKPDLVVINGCSDPLCSAEGGVGILLGNGDGTFRAAISYDSGGWNLSDPGSRVAVVDVNGDGKLDLVVSNCGPAGSSVCGNGVVGVLLGNGDGTFRAAVGYDSGGVGASSLVVADVNRDGKPDVIVANVCATPAGGCDQGGGPSEGSVSILLGNGDGTFKPAVVYDSGGISAFSVAVKDVNSDGKPDLLVGNCGIQGCGSTGSGVGVLLGNGDGTFQPALLDPALPVTFVEAADVNDDDKLDLIVLDPEEGVGILPGNGDGTFQAAQVYGSGAANVSGIAVADLNGDGWPDVVAANGCYTGCFSGGPVGVLMNVAGRTLTTTTLTSSPSWSYVGQTVTFTAVVSPTYSGGTPVGMVIFSDESTVLGSATLVNGSASFSTSSVPVGVHTIIAAYQGSGNFLASSALLTLYVYEPPTTTTLTSSENPAFINQSVTYSAVVNNQSGEPITGTITFIDNHRVIATLTLTNQKATKALSYKKASTHTIQANYSGDANNSPSYASLKETIVSYPVKSATLLTTSGSPSPLGQSVTFTAKVTPVYGTIPDGELVTFYDKSTEIGTGATSDGVATFTTSSLTKGTHLIKATYSGDAKVKPSTGQVKQMVKK